MQSLRDAGIVLIVILLLVSVRFSPLDETGQAMGLVSLTPQVEAASVVVPLNVARIDASKLVVPANAAVRSTPEQFSILEWVLNDGEEIVRKADGQQANAFNAGDVSFHPRFGTEFNLKNVVALRAGINRVTNSDRYGTNFTPSVGAGLRLKQVNIDYGFGDFGGLASDLGYSHRISVQLTLERPCKGRFDEAERAEQ